MATKKMSAKMLQTSANAVSAYAVIRLFEKNSDIKESYGDRAFDYWKDFCSQLVIDLSVAISEEQPDLFRDKIRWERAAFLAREVDPGLIRLVLDCLGETIQEELPPPVVADSQEFIALAVKDFDDPLEREAHLQGNDPMTQLAGEYLVKILEGDTHGAIAAVVQAHEKGMELVDAYMALTRAQLEVGRMWHVAEISIAEEHLVTHTTHRAMSVLNFGAERAAPKGKTLISSAVEGNYHDLGIRAVTDFFEFDGWRVICLGSDTPAHEIGEAASIFEASLVMLSANMSNHLDATRKTISVLRESAPDCKILLGGEVFVGTPELAESLGGDGCTIGIEEAVKLGNQLCGC